MQVERLELVSAFRRDPTVYLARGPQLQQLASRYNARIISVNTPEQAPPELPRLVLRFDRSVLQVGLNRFQFVIQPPKHVANRFDEALMFAANLANPVLGELFDGGKPEFEWTGIVAVLNYPADIGAITSATEASRPLVERLTKLSAFDDALSTFELKIGRKQNGFFRNYAVSGYESRQIEVRVPAGTRAMELSLKSAPVVEVGVTVTLDVNSQPAPHRESPEQDLDQTIAEILRAQSTLLDDLNLTGIL